MEKRKRKTCINIELSEYRIVVVSRFLKLTIWVFLHGKMNFWKKVESIFELKQKIKFLELTFFFLLPI